MWKRVARKGVGHTDGSSVKHGFGSQGKKFLSYQQPLETSKHLGKRNEVIMIWVLQRSMQPG